MKKTVFALMVIYFSSNCFAQIKNYQIRDSQVKCEKSLSDFSILTIEKENLTLNEDDDNLLLSSGLTTFLVGTIAKIPEYITQYLETQKLKFTANYEAKNTLMFSSSRTALPKLTFERYFFKKDNNKEKALSLVLCPKLIQDNKYLAFGIESLDYKFSKAKLKKRAPRINLLVEITITYSKASIETQTIEKTETKSAAILIPVNLNNEIQDESIELMKNKLSDVFIVDNITEISVKITEINPYKLKLEELENLINKNKEDLSGLFSELSKLLK